jgi:hypothetical protein
MLKSRQPQKKINPETHRLKLDFKRLNQTLLIRYSHIYIIQMSPDCDLFIKLRGGNLTVHDPDTLGFT